MWLVLSDQGYSKLLWARLAKLDHTATLSKPLPERPADHSLSKTALYMHQLVIKRWLYTKFTPCLWSEALWLASPCRGSQRDSVSYILHTHSRSHHTFSQQSATVWTERCWSSPHPPLVTLSNSPISLVLWAICSVVYRKEPSRCLLVLFLFSGLFETCVVMQ